MSGDFEEEVREIDLACWKGEVPSSKYSTFLMDEVLYKYFYTL